MLPNAESLQIILPILSILFLVFGFFRPVYGVISYFLVLNAKLGDMYPVLGAIRFEFLVAVIVLITIFINGRGLNNILPRQNKLNKYLWILFAIGMVSIVQAVDVQISWQFGGYPLLKMVLFYIMVVCGIQDESDLNIMIWAFILVTVWIAYEPVTNYFSGKVSEKVYGEVAVGRYGVARGHVALANTLSQCLPLAIHFFMVAPKKYKPLLITFIVLIISGIVLSKSRGGFLGLVFIALGFIFISKKKTETIIVCILLAIPMFVVIGDEYISHIGSIADGIYGSRSSSDRFLGLVNGIDMFLRRPIMGVGIGCYATARSYYFNYYFYSHNLYGELIGELGLCSFIWFYWIWHVWMYRRKFVLYDHLKENEKHYYLTLLTGIQFSLLLRLFLGNFTHGSFIWFWFLMAALTVSIGNLCNPGSEEKNADKLNESKVR